MTRNCSYTFSTPDGQQRTVTGMAEFKAYLATGGIEAFAAPGSRLVRASGRIVQTDTPVSGKVIPKVGAVETVRDVGMTHQITVVKGGASQDVSDLISVVGKAFGKRVVFFDSPTLQADGFVRNDDNARIYINARTQISPLAVFGHELMHLVKRDNPIAHEAVQRVVEARLTPEAWTAFQQDYQDGANIDELTSDLMGNAFQDRKFLSEVVAEIERTAPKGQAPSIVRQVFAAINKVIDRVVALVKSGQFQADRFAADRIMGDVTQIREALKDTLVSYLEQQRGATRDVQQSAVEEPGATYGTQVSEPTGRTEGAGPAGSGVPGDIRPAARVRDTKAPKGNYYVRTVIGKREVRRLGAATIQTPKQAAQATKYLYRSAVERFDAIVTNKDGKPLAVVGGFKGALTQTAVYPATIVGEAMRVPGAARIWFSHNHPSGTAELSSADRMLLAGLVRVFRGSGIEPMGILAIAGDRYAWEGADNRRETADIGPVEAGAKVPVVERELDAVTEARPTITSPMAAKQVATDLYAAANGPGMILLDAQNRLAAWVNLDRKMLGTLRDTGGLAAIYRAVSEANANGAILVHNGEFDNAKTFPGGVTVSQNIGAALAQLDVGVLDVINLKTGQSDAERGRSLVDGPVFSLQRQAAQGEARVGSTAQFSKSGTKAKKNPLNIAIKEETSIARAVVSSKPGRQFGGLRVVRYPTGTNTEFVTSRLHERASRVLNSSSTREFFQNVLSIADKSIRIGQIRGLWAGEREDTFVVNAKAEDGSDLSFDQTRILANILGMAFVQEGAVTVAPSYNAQEQAGGIPSILIGKPDGSSLTRAEIDNALAEADKAGFFGASEAVSGKGIKFLFFPDDSSSASPVDQFNDFVAKVDAVQRATGLTGSGKFSARSALDEAKDYWSHARGVAGDQQDQRGAGDQGSSGGSLDLFRGIVDHLLAPYVAELKTEGFEFSIRNWQRAFGATREQANYLALKVAAFERLNKHGVVHRLRQQVSIAKMRDVGSHAVLNLKTTNKNAEQQLAHLDMVLAASPNAVASTEEWLRMEARAYGTGDVPMAPNRFIQMYNGDGIYEQLKTLTPGQVQDADHGFESGREFRRLYESGQVKPETTAKLMLWSFLSRGVSPYVQESAFIDLVDRVDPFVQKVVNGTFTEADADAWDAIVSATIRKGTGQPGAGSTHNANAFGGTFMRGMAQAMPDGRTKMQFMHDLFSDPTKNGRQIRREFVKIGEGVGIDNKVISFTMLVIGHDDVAVLDRVQIANTFNDGRLGDYNLYDGVTRYGYKEAGKTVWIGTGEQARLEAADKSSDGSVESSVEPGSGLADLTTGVRGLMIYEPIELALDKKLPAIYDRLKSEGLRSKDVRPTAGRWHWESWVAYSGQEASHKTLEALLNEVKGKPNPFADVSAKEGEYGAYSYATEYAVDKNGNRYKLYPDSTGRQFKFSLDGYKSLMADIKKAKNGVVPTRFKVSANADGSSRSRPWWDDPRVNRAKLDALIAKHGEPVGITPSRQRQTETPEFREWSKGLPVYDSLEDGENRRGVYKLYHATASDTNILKPGGRDAKISGLAIWLSPDADFQPAMHNIAARDAEFRDGTNVIPVYARLERPLVIDDKTMLEWAQQTFAGGSREFPQLISPQAMREVTRDGEYDSIIFDGRILNWGDKSREVIVFAEDQIKSAIGNVGTFGRRSPTAQEVENLTLDEKQQKWQRLNGSERMTAAQAEVWQRRGDIRLSRQRSPLGFYSALAEAVDASKINATIGGGWKNEIKGWINKGMVKADEIEWSGLNEWLDLQKGKVSREQVAEYLRAGGVQVEETVLGDLKDFSALSDEQLRKEYVRIRGFEPEAYGEPMTRDEILDELDEAMDDDLDDTKFGSYTLPGGKNYREVLLTLPGGRLGSETFRQSAGVEVWIDGRLDGRSDRELAEQRLAAFRANPAFANRTMELRPVEAEASPVDREYRSPHWDQPNVLAHLRVNDRVDADGSRVLFVEEIQSDFGQDIRKQREAIERAVDDDFLGIVARMEKAGVLSVECD